MPSRHVLPRQMEDAGTNNPPTTRKENEPAARESSLPEEYRLFMEHSKEKDLMRKEAQEKLERANSDHEKDMWHLKLEFRIQVDGLTREKEELQSTIDAFQMLFEKMRGEQTTEIQELTQAMQLLWSELYAKDKELKVIHDAHDALVKKLEDERAQLPSKLAKAAKEALALQSNAKPSNEAVAAKAAALVHDTPHHLHG
ncbi:hypothetical protein J4E81_000879 [Alternaria sp. BMP 2799]|nr:hypothetical protein J4E81_000879 [Alternaria sp. BMP 2799]